MPGPIEFHEVCLPDEEAAALEALRPHVERFKLHPLTVEDCTRRNQRCKLESFEEYLFLVWHVYTPRGEGHQELHVCLRTDGILVIAEGRPPEGSSWREYLLRGRGAEGNVKQLGTMLLDRLVDEAEDHLDVLQDDAAELEHAILSRTMNPEEVLRLKRLVKGFNRSMRSAQPICSQLLEMAEKLPQIGEFSLEERLRLRNVVDHMTRLLEATQLLEGQMGTLMDVHWGAMGARANEQMQRLTTIATVFLPVSFWSGLFGMNFETMPFKEAWFFWCGMGALVLTWVVVIFYMLRRGVFAKQRPGRHRRLLPKREISG
ncbi:MAG: magnesium transporter CorA family protein [Polyangiaceae bacterium]|jgi:magnesium transporter|nr:magnesium transporter CorA family protein [Polyangiaceae bacterium]